ncbi:MAG: hypothetical protein K5657_00145, partial [Desulfovibrio sp.]|nr:hypothetical protein [Desulfovibrio sp.]
EDKRQAVRRLAVSVVGTAACFLRNQPCARSESHYARGLSYDAAFEAYSSASARYLRSSAFWKSRGVS